MLQVWLKFKRWLRTLSLELSKGSRIDWWTKINELVAIINLWLDRKPGSSTSIEPPETLPTSPTPPPSQPEPPPEREPLFPFLGRRRRRSKLWQMRNPESKQDG